MYNIGLYAYYLGINLAAPLNDKAKQWVEGRKNWKENLLKKSENLDRQKKTAWFHVSSLGEFEQGRPVMEKLKASSNINLVLSFYSPSGYEIMKDWELADIICYLPFDTKMNAKEFISIVQPDLAIFVKYDLWYYYLSQLKKKAIPSVLIAARFYPSQVFFKPWGKWYRKLIFFFTKILVQDNVSFELLESIGYKDVVNTGDPRYDRVLELSKNNDIFEEIEEFIEGKDVFIAGSSWPLDEKIMLEYMLENTSDLRFIIAPHDISREHTRSLKNKLNGKAILYSEIDKRKKENVLIIDSIGILSRLYKYADISYIGGAFKEGLHNILEPAAYGIPVITGPDHSGFLEGPAMEKAGGLYRIKNKREFTKVISSFIEDKEGLAKASSAAFNFISENTGASEITNSILEEFL